MLRDLVADQLAQVLRGPDLAAPPALPTLRGRVERTFGVVEGVTLTLTERAAADGAGAWLPTLGQVLDGDVLLDPRSGVAEGLVGDGLLLEPLLRRQVGAVLVAGRDVVRLRHGGKVSLRQGVVDRLDGLARLVGVGCGLLGAAAAVVTGRLLVVTGGEVRQPEVRHPGAVLPAPVPLLPVELLPAAVAAAATATVPLLPLPLLVAEVLAAFPLTAGVLVPVVGGVGELDLVEVLHTGVLLGLLLGAALLPLPLLRLGLLGVTLRTPGPLEFEVDRVVLVTADLRRLSGGVELVR